MIDIHCHILPGIDDGPASLAESLELARACVADGITHVVATPHVFPGRFDNVRSGIALACDAFRESLIANGIVLELSFAGEVRLSHEVLDLVAADQIPYLGVCDAYRIMLLELPDSQIPLGSINLVRHLMGQRIRPVLVHPERNKAAMEKPERIAQFVDAGCYLQITAGSLLGQFGSRVSAATDYFLEHGWVSVVASDSHNLRGRPPRMREAFSVLQRRFGFDLARELTQLAPARLCGMPVPKKPPSP